MTRVFQLHVIPHVWKVVKCAGMFRFTWCQRAASGHFHQRSYRSLVISSHLWLSYTWLNLMIKGTQKPPINLSIQGYLSGNILHRHIPISCFLISHYHETILAVKLFTLITDNTWYIHVYWTETHIPPGYPCRNTQASLPAKVRD